MGTRGLIHVFEGEPLDTNLLVTIYRQFDCYPEGLGKELVEFLAPIKLVNGIPVSDREAEEQHMANGMGCLAAQLIAHMKEKVGNVYIRRPGCADVGEEFTYSIYREGAYAVTQDGDRLRLKCEPEWYDEERFEGDPEGCDKVRFDGYPEDFMVWVETVWAERD